MLTRTLLELYLVGKFQNQEYPFVKIQTDKLKDYRLDIRISFIGTHHHYSLHQAKIIKTEKTTYILSLHNQQLEFPKIYTGPSPIIFTSFDLDKQKSTWDNEITGVANKFGLDGLKHIKYYENRVLPLGSNSEFQLGGRRIVLGKTKKYPADKCVYFERDVKDFFMYFYFSSDGNFSRKLDSEFDIQIGKLGLLFK